MDSVDNTFEPMKGYEGYYEINRLGQIRTVPKIMKDSDCLGYRHLVLSKEGKASTVRIHRALAIQFIPNPENKPYVNHKNLDRSDNKIENLEWCTQEENVKHAILNGKRGGNFKLDKEKIENIKKSTDTQKNLAESYNVSQSAISAVRNGKTWNDK